MRKIYSLLIAALFVGSASFAQVTVTGNTNTTPALLASYPDLTTAITAYNSVTTIAGPVSFSLAAGNPQNAPVGGYSIIAIPAGASAINTVTFIGNGNNVTAPLWVAGGLTDGILKIVGGDFITISGFNFLENSRPTIVANDSSSLGGIKL